ncbi:hypothetical protein [Nonomuraea turcica]|uniref:hypothetical protein n=1 Tax=Nonomuraea sp. G32 TaxID=3067274 RepID=UPI00273AA6FC|nr:hypothetical protein [Nonomuraea sp. G32]MDP4506942.1 hypothetical protein [Nonomuraea sp. G32]
MSQWSVSGAENERRQCASFCKWAVRHDLLQASPMDGIEVWRQSGLGTSTGIDALNQKITHLEQQTIDLRLQLEERDEDLAAARATSRELMTQLHRAARRR